MKTEKARGGFTKGQFEVGIKHPSRIILNELRGRVVAFTCDPRDEGAESSEEKANADLIAAAFNSATEVEDMGLDGLEAVRMLPKTLIALRTISDFPCNCPPDGIWGECESCIARALLARLKKD